MVALTAWVASFACRNVGISARFESICSQDGHGHRLEDILFQGAAVYLPGSEGFTEATTRWSSLYAPNLTLVVSPSVEDDVAKTVQYANEKDLPFLVVNGGHGAIKTVGALHNGIGIWMNRLSSVEILEDDSTAKFGGGTLSKIITDTLWAAGKQTVTGGCECTSLLGPGLGGGHGFLQGRHGLISDQFVSMNVVLANGSLTTVSATSNPDLWWGLQGAGHNFGIVTSVTSKIYPVQYPDWAYVSFIYLGDKVEALYAAINDHLLKGGSQPVDIINYSFFFSSPDIDPTKPVIMFYILQEGVTAVDSAYTSPFYDLDPITTAAEGGSYTDLPAWTGNALESPPCQKSGLVNMRFPIDLESYDIAAQRKVYDLFAQAFQDTPALNGSLFLFEGYSLQGIRAVPSESTAYPFRNDNLLIAPLITYAPGGPELDNQAVELGEKLRQVLYEASGRTERHTYVNYAYGDESQRNWYGYEEWRQTKLEQLKNTYDPKRRLSFYAPIA